MAMFSFVNNYLQCGMGIFVHNACMVCNGIDAKSKIPNPYIRMRQNIDAKMTTPKQYMPYKQTDPSHSHMASVMLMIQGSNNPSQHRINSCSELRWEVVGAIRELEKTVLHGIKSITDCRQSACPKFREAAGEQV